MDTDTHRGGSNFREGCLFVRRYLVSTLLSGMAQDTFFSSREMLTKGEETSSVGGKFSIYPG